MIELTIPCAFDDHDALPFVAQLHLDNADGSVNAHSAMLAAEDSAECIFQIRGRTLTLKKRSGETPVHGEIIFIDPQRQRAHRWIRADSQHNTLLITEQCDQLCVMCSQPPKKSHTDLFDHFIIACQLAPKNSTIGLSGGEPTLHKGKLFALLNQLRVERPDLTFHVLTNAQHIVDDDLPMLRRLQNVFWGVPLYAADPATHDQIVGKDGAFVQLQQNLSIMGLAGAAIELRTVVMRQNVAGLPKLAKYLASSLSFIDVWAVMQLENAGFAKNNWADLFFDHSSSFAAIANACTVAELHGIAVAIYNFPLCTVPQAWRGVAKQSISDWKRKYLAACDSCSAKRACSGFFEWHPAEHGFKELRPL